MNYPFWDTAIGYGPLMASIAVLHVFVSHFAIGGGLYLVLTERAARKSNDTAMLGFLTGLSRFFAQVTLVLGALTGVGIWFVIGLLNPAATEVLIHNFVWGWATEWTFFVVEITAAILYYYGWERMSPRNHMILGWIYFVFAWLSLFVINGILTFMLTPGRWAATGGFWDGFFNPTFWPSLVFRTGVSVMLAGLYALLIASRGKPDAFKARLVRHNSWWSFTGLAIMAPSFYWYWRAIPPEITAAARRTMPTPVNALDYSFWLAAGVAILLALFGLLLPKRQHLTVGILGMALGLAWFGSFEWFRESIRKPWVIEGYMYGNAVEPARKADYQSGGYLSSMLYRTGDDGADLWRRACRSCHTLGGYKALVPALDGTDEPFLASLVQSAVLIRGNMPPFLGTAEEAGKLAAYLHARLDHRPLGEIYGLEGVALGRKVYQIRCAVCHAKGSTRDNIASITGLSVQDYTDMLDMAAILGEGMPAFTGGEQERAALIEYLESLGKGGTK